MLTIEGTYKDGTIVLTDPPADVTESRVLVTFVQPEQINLAERGIDRDEAAELRAKLSTISDDWDRSEMDIYDVD
jgi:hypothetical protein